MPAKNNSRIRPTPGVRTVSFTRLLLVMLAVASLAPLVLVIAVRAQQLPMDPGVRGGPPAAGHFFNDLTHDQTAVELSFFKNFIQINGVTEEQTGKLGLGPLYNANQCSACHAQPAIGGVSPSSNPAFQVYNTFGATNTIPFFELSNGPMLNARFPFQLGDPSVPDNQVHQIFTITGRLDAGACDLSQPNFTEASSMMDLSFRDPLPLFGDGLIEIIQESDILANQMTQCAAEGTTGICGTPSYAVDGGLNRFGWKAQNRSLLIFSAEADSAEEGVTNEQFPNELNETPACLINPIPEDHSQFAPLPPHRFPGDAERFALFADFWRRPRPPSSTRVP